jgi:ribosome recycling factor
VKVAKKTAEDCRVSVRKARHDAINMLAELKKEGAASEDDVERAKKRVEEVVGAAGQAIDGVVQGKEKEILAI